MKYLLLLFTITFQGQILHHQMLSAQGITKELSTGTIVKQTVGQITAAGNYDGDSMMVGQGFQQSSWEKLIIANNHEVMEAVKTYPNPFVDIINFEFSKPIADLLSITIFDVNGRVVFEKKEQVENTVLTLDLAQLPRALYLVRLNSSKFNYYIKIIKQL